MIGIMGLVALLGANGIVQTGALAVLFILPAPVGPGLLTPMAALLGSGL